MVVVGAPTFHSRLQAATADIHRRLEAAIHLDRRVSDIGAYKDFVVRLRHIHAVVATALRDVDWAGVPVDLTNVARRLAWLDEDLASLGHPLARSARLNISLATAAEGLGCLYVVEGSALGGRLIYRQAEAGLGISANRGGRFFFGHGKHANEVWTAFLRVLNAVDPAMVCAARAEEAAQRTFFLFERGLGV